ncbi:hypothetical protein [Cupriavidus sp. L7L]|uniref:hypothetical protein n=1 Tax=Cupriavidus sp. L7L TaxID=2546443 RepID=UPI001055C2EF|nr:hypothetical protein [Cupriavidus sp. L7L]TDF65733.1 hypothetical protein E1J61_14455 [Cupriavidus sp. L7L]
MDELVQRYLKATEDPRKVVTDPEARYFGAELKEGTLVPEGASLAGQEHLRGMDGAKPRRAALKAGTRGWPGSPDGLRPAPVTAFRPAY